MEVLEVPYSRIVRQKNLKKEQSHLTFFTALDPTEYRGMIIKEVGVSVFTNHKIKTTKKRNTAM